MFLRHFHGGHHGDLGMKKKNIFSWVNNTNVHECVVYAYPPFQRARIMQVTPFEIGKELPVRIFFKMRIFY